ncbi:hypothetical protein K457DRAFT_797273 [Linnemannia elongata AG-77]|uniref:Uncharacterized protein n=1 Tax=Linnemannia elongata AG-77 TaxID=1314771 RepID=A0A197JJ84_9FUNG|nr:hypothetical protein K457DRAFT_797273 [Linnemannia elongata AG-77]
MNLDAFFTHRPLLNPLVGFTLLLLSFTMHNRCKWPWCEILWVLGCALVTLFIFPSCVVAPCFYLSCPFSSHSTIFTLQPSCRSLIVALESHNVYRRGWFARMDC